MKRISLIALLLITCFAQSGCSIVACNRVFPKLTWYWDADARACRKDRQGEKLWDAQSKTNQPGGPR